MPVNEKKEYFCSFCRAEWTAMEVLDSVGPEGFICHRCRHPLSFEADRNAGGHEQSTRLNDQFKFISELLPKIDAAHIPECDFDRALSKARPVVRDATHQRAATIPVDDASSRPMAVRGLANTGPQSIAVNISTSDGPSEAEKEADRLRKEKIAQQNALPAWMSNSTITGESFSAAADANALGASRESAGRNPSQSKLADNTSSTQIDDIFEKLKAEQAAILAREEDEEEEEEYEEEEEDDEFEDVMATGNNSGLGTPGTKTEVSEAPTGDASRNGDSAEDRAIKRVKVEPEVKKENSGIDEDEDDDEVEFEDV